MLVVRSLLAWRLWQWGWVWSLRPAAQRRDLASRVNRVHRRRSWRWGRVFPFSGNGGYDVLHYDLDFTYTPPAPAPAPLIGELDGVATIDFEATQDLDRLEPRPARDGRGGRHDQRPSCF